jgi:hypothetical protein
MNALFSVQKSSHGFRRLCSPEGAKALLLFGTRVLFE